MQELVMDNIIRLLSEIGYFDLLKSEVGFEKFIQSLTTEQFKNLLVTFNAKLRNIPVKEKGTQKEGFMIVGDWISPTKNIQDKMLENLLNALKQLSDKKDRATLLYYMLIDLHMFEDANGRTARFFYDLMSGEIDLNKNIKWYLHNESDNSMYETSFEKYKGLLDISELNYLIGLPMIADLENNGVLIDERVKNKAVCTYGDGYVQMYSGVPISETIKKQLTIDEIQEINSLLLDNSGKYTVGGLTMLIMAIKKGQLEQWIQHNHTRTELVMNLYPKSKDAELRKRRFIFSLIKDKEMFNNWTAEDYKEIIIIGNEIKERVLSHMIGIFLNPESYMFKDKTTYKENIYSNFKGVSL